jgi:hypothetical protein
MKNRVLISAVYNDFTKEIASLKLFQIDNHTKFNNREISKGQFHLLTEGVFFNSYRSFDNFIRDVFLLYTQEKRRADGSKPSSHLKPRDFAHANDLIKSSSRFAEWDSPDTMIDRSDLFLKNDTRFKIIYSTHVAKLRAFKKIRNHVAHNSPESSSEYEKTMLTFFTTIPSKIPSVGELLVTKSRINPLNNILEDYFVLVVDIANNLK